MDPDLHIRGGCGRPDPKGGGGGAGRDGGSGSNNFQFGLKIRYGGLEGWPGLFLEQTKYNVVTM